MDVVPVDQLRIPNATTAIPRLRTESFLVSEYAAAMRLYGGWGDFPPILCDQDNLVLDGVTRVLAAIAAEVDQAHVEIQVCENDGERLLLAVGANSAHGKRWSVKDTTNIVILADRMGVNERELASVMRVSIEHIERVPITTVSRGKTEIRVYAKRAARRAVMGRVLTEHEHAVMRSIATPHFADRLLLDLLRLHELNALPTLNPESFQTVVAARSILDEWIDRDGHALEAV
jgi:hypothetical protein